MKGEKKNMVYDTFDPNNIFNAEKIHEEIEAKGLSGKEAIEYIDQEIKFAETQQNTAYKIAQNKYMRGIITRKTLNKLFNEWEEEIKKLKVKRKNFQREKARWNITEDQYNKLIDLLVKEGFISSIPEKGKKINWIGSWAACHYLYKELKERKSIISNGFTTFFKNYFLLKGEEKTDVQIQNGVKHNKDFFNSLQPQKINRIISNIFNTPEK